MKKLKFASVIVFFSMFIAVSAYAEIMSDTVSVIIDNQWIANQTVDDAYFDLYSAGGEYLGTGSCSTASNTRGVMTFNVPQYAPGEKFDLRLKSGYALLQHCDDIITDSGSFELGTYAYSDENGQTVMNNNFYITGVPRSGGKINFLAGNRHADMDVKICGGVPAAPADLLFDNIGIPCSWDTYSMTAEYNGIRLVMTPDSSIVSVNGSPADMGMKMTYIDGSFYVPIGFAVSVFGIPVSVDEYNGNTNINAVIFKKHIVKDINSDSGVTAAAAPAGSPSEGNSTAENHVNSAGISSRTDYLIWISKKDYKLHVFLGSAGNWKLCRTFDCTIGKDSSPTITGQFEYYSRESKWTYDNFYVGPIMRFKGGYAIHSTLLSYSGGDYDSRVGMKLSHGCVRVRKPDIDWLVSYVPLYTKIYITE